MRTFVHTSHPSRVVFGSGRIGQLAEEVRRLGGGRVLLLSGPSQAKAAARVRDVLGGLMVAQFDGAAMHTPVEVTEQALAVVRQAGADCLVSVGGGSSTGLSKALAVRTGLPQVVVPTTYAGSEVTPVLGETQGGRKTTRSSAAVLPETVLYDADFTLSMPLALSVASAVNALAHAVEALYAADANPVTDRQALQAVALIGRALPPLADDPADRDARSDLLEAAWLAGTCLATVGMGLHHKLCHTLGGAFGLPHAQTHTVVLPQVMAYTAAAPEGAKAMERIASALGVPDAASGVHDLIASLGGPLSLRELGMAEEDLARAAALATTTPYPHPRPVSADSLAGLLADAWHGRRPTGPDTTGRRPNPRGPGTTASQLAALRGQVVDSFAAAPDTRARELLGGLVRHLHDYVAEHQLTHAEWGQAIDFLTLTGQTCDTQRQEFVLLSDTLGISSAVDILTGARTPDTTPTAVLGPFYVEGPPETAHGQDISGGLPGTPLWVDATITDTTGQPVPGAIVDVWQSNEDGFYDVQLPDLEGPVLRGRLRTAPDGRLAFWSILPSAYPIPGDGPVGQLLTSTGRHLYRAPHLHFMITAPGHHRLITQLFVAGGEHLDSDTVFGVKDALIVDFTPTQGPGPDGRVLTGPWRRLEHTFRIAPTTPTTPTTATTTATD